MKDRSGAPRSLVATFLFLLLEACFVPLPWLLISEDTPRAYLWIAKQPPGTVVLEFCP
jgi:hypothetical protein